MKKIFIGLILVALFSFLFKHSATKQSMPSRLSPENSAEKASEACSNYSVGTILRNTCYARQMEQITVENGRTFAEKTLSSLQSIDESAKGCHFISHGIGWGSYKKDPTNWKQAIQESSPLCAYGEQMGIIERYVQAMPDGKFTKEFVPEICGDHPRASCNHMVGHMVLLQTKNDIPKAIDYCHSLKTGAQQSLCFAGMFMERVISTNLVEHEIVPKSWANWPARIFDNEKLCRSYEGELANTCWRVLGHAAYYHFNKEPKAIFAFCNSAKSQRASQECKLYAVNEFIGSNGFSFQMVKNICSLDRKHDQQFESLCYNRMAFLKINALGREKTGDTVAFCSHLGSQFQASCFQSISYSLKSTQATESQIKKFCLPVPQQYKNLCEHGFSATISQNNL